MTSRSPRLCSIENCGRVHLARGWCIIHYSRWQRWGDPLMIKQRASQKGIPFHGHVALGRRPPMDEWEMRHVSRLLKEGLSYRQIQRSTGIGYKTVYRFVKKNRQLQSA